MKREGDKPARIAGLELNALRASGGIGAEFDGLTIAQRGTPIHDINGALLFYRLALSRGKAGAGYVDIAVNEVMGEPLVAVASGAVWDEKALVRAGAAMARKCLRKLSYDTVRFVAYSFPKLALQFLSNGAEVLMLELHTWKEVPQVRYGERRPMEPGNFERWSLLEELPKDIRLARARTFRKRLAVWDRPKLRRVNLSVIDADSRLVAAIKIRLFDTRELHYSQRDADHHVCYELRGQQTDVWCVAASTEMLLNFYRYHYSQVRLAQELGLGTLSDPNGLPYSRDGDVVTVIEDLSQNTLDATLTYNPSFSLFRNEILANRPVISFVPGHSRTVAGYTRSLLVWFGALSFQGLLVYDPWPPNAGVITRWENFATHTYRAAFTAVLQHV